MEKEKEEMPKEELAKLNLQQRLNRIMGEWDYIKKDKEIKGKDGRAMYNVTGHDAVTAYIHPLLVKWGVMVWPSMDNITQDGNRTTAYMSFDFINIDNPEDKFTRKWYSYGIGSAVTSDADDGGYGYRIKKVQDSTTSYPSRLTDYSGSNSIHSRRYFYSSNVSSVNNWFEYDTFQGVDADSHTTSSLTYTI